MKKILLLRVLTLYHISTKPQHWLSGLPDITVLHDANVNTKFTFECTLDCVDLQLSKTYGRRGDFKYSSG